MSKEVDLKESQVSVLIEVNGMIHMVAMDKEKYEAISTAVKLAAHQLIRTNRSQEDLLNFLTNK